MAGHSHWKTIKRAKGATDAKRGKVWSKIARKIIIAAKMGGGDPGQNLSLRYVVEEAKSALMHKETIEKAIGYDVRYALLGTGATPGTWTSRTLIGPKKTTFSNLTPGATYAFQVRALGRLGYTNWSDPIMFICG